MEAQGSPAVSAASALLPWCGEAQLLLADYASRRSISTSEDDD
jgi:hypothetical protein